MFLNHDELLYFYVNNIILAIFRKNIVIFHFLKKIRFFAFSLLFYRLNRHFHIILKQDTSFVVLLYHYFLIILNLDLN